MQFPMFFPSDMKWLRIFLLFVTFFQYTGAHLEDNSFHLSPGVLIFWSTLEQQHLCYTMAIPLFTALVFVCFVLNYHLIKPPHTQLKKNQNSHSLSFLNTLEVLACYALKTKKKRVQRSLQKTRLPLSASHSNSQIRRHTTKKNPMVSLYCFVTVPYEGSFGEQQKEAWAGVTHSVVSERSTMRMMPVHRRRTCCTEFLGKGRRKWSEMSWTHMAKERERRRESIFKALNGISVLFSAAKRCS